MGGIPIRFGWRQRLVCAGLLYVLLLGVSFVFRHSRQPTANAGPRARVAVVWAVDQGNLTSERVRIAYREDAPASGGPVETILLLHGSPGRKEEFENLVPLLAEYARVIAPDLPGFGSSTHALPDYSFHAHAIYTRQLLDRLDIQRAHVLGYSMGGGVALNLTDLAPERVASLTMLSAVGVQEMELTGDYYLNHGVHGLQLIVLWLLREATPHMGLLDHAMFGVPYARNFFDSDQRPLRDIMRRVTSPTLIVHGLDDDRVPIEAAREHHRLVPQSDLVSLDGNHFLLFAKAPVLADIIGRFVRRAEQRRGPTRADADPVRIHAATLPFDPIRLPRVRGIAAVVVGALLIIAAWLSEDLMAVVAGVLVARGRVSFALAVQGCLIGTLVFDLALFLAGRCFGRCVIGALPMKWLLRQELLERRLTRLSRRSPATLFLTRFQPGRRRPDYLAAGVLRMGTLQFLGPLLLATALWIPALVGVSAMASPAILAFRPVASLPQHMQLACVVGVLALGLKVIVATASPWGRRLLMSSWGRVVTRGTR